MSRNRKWLALFCTLALIIVACSCAFLHLGEWLQVQDPLTPAYAIVVLSGRLPERAMEAARLYEKDFAAQVWVSTPVGPAAQLEKMQIAFVGEEFYNQKVLMSMGVPADAIHVFDNSIVNTEEEVDEIARECRRDGAHKVIVVTSKPHTRRVRLIWRKRIGNDPQIIVRYATDDRFDAAHWWRKSQDGLDVVREVLGIANAWMGFPARPEPRT